MTSIIIKKINKISGAAKLLFKAFSGYKKSILILIALSLFAGFFEGIGINSLIPLLSFVTGEGVSGEVDSVTAFLQNAFTY